VPVVNLLTERSNKLTWASCSSDSLRRAIFSFVVMSISRMGLDGSRDSILSPLRSGVATPGRGAPDSCGRAPGLLTATCQVITISEHIEQICTALILYMYINN